MAEMKSYLMNMQLEMLTDDDETVKAIHVNHLNNEPIPLQLFCDFLERLNRMVPEESVLFVGDSITQPKSLVEKGKAYVISKSDGEFITGDYFEGISAFELKHCRSGKIVRINREAMENFFCVGDYDPHYADPISPETKEMIEKVSKGCGRRNTV